MLGVALVLGVLCGCALGEDKKDPKKAFAIVQWGEVFCGAAIVSDNHVLVSKACLTGSPSSLSLSLSFSNHDLLSSFLFLVPDP